MSGRNKLSPISSGLSWEGFVRNLRREATPERVYCFEHGISENLQEQLAMHFGLWDALGGSEDYSRLMKPVAVNRFLGLELLRVCPPRGRMTVPERHEGWEDEQSGIISSWEDFDKFPWPDPAAADFSCLEFYDKVLPRDMRTFAVIDLWESVRALLGFAPFCFLLYEDPPLVREVTRKVAEYDLALVRSYCDFDCHAVVYISDDFGHKTAPMMAPKVIREYFLPWHKRFADEAHARGKFVFFHSDGYILDIIPDLIEIGVNALNCQLFCMDVEELGRRFKGRITFWGEMDRQWVLPFGKPEDVRRAVQRVRQALEGDNGSGGVIAQMEWGKNDPQENVETVFEAWLE